MVCVCLTVYNYVNIVNTYIFLFFISRQRFMFIMCKNAVKDHFAVLTSTLKSKFYFTNNHFFFNNHRPDVYRHIKQTLETQFDAV